MNPKIITLIAVGSFIGLGALPSAMATPQVTVGYSGSVSPAPIPTRSGYGQFQIGSGGEFTFQPNADLAGLIDLNAYDASKKTKDYGVNLGAYGSFQTFCMEIGEHIYPFPNTYNVSLSDAAIEGGVGPSGDALSAATAYLYYEFARGTLSGFDYTKRGTAPGSKSGDLQKAIWYLEAETGGVANAFVTAANTALAAMSIPVGANNAKGNGELYFPVKVMNVTDAQGNRYQDGLVVVGVPDGGTSLLLLGVGVGSLAFVSRRWRK